MKFEDVLKRYHISPLQYEDGTLLRENDYIDLLKILNKYAYVKSKTGTDFKFLVPATLMKKIEFAEKNTLIPISEEDMMDILMEQNSNSVIES